MRNIKYTLVMVICLTFLNCASTSNQTSNDGSSMEKAIKVGNVEQEYKIVREKCNDCQIKSQSLTFNDKNNPFDVITLIKSNGEEVKYYFDIKSFFGKF
ncbi:MAG: hypothetical protein ACRC8Z_09180 [Empedobacter falsenii]